jgi:hypothetical protein
LGRSFKDKKMKNLISAFFIISLSMTLFSCGDKNEYDWNKVIPGKQQITGRDSIKGNGIAEEYLAIPRGGSSYDWKILSGAGTFVQDPDRPYRIELQSTSQVSGTIVLCVTETTHGGVVGTPDTINIILTPVCDFNINLFTGAFVGKEQGFADYSINFTHTSGDTIINDNFFNSAYQVPFVFPQSGRINETFNVVPTTVDYNGEPGIIKGSGTYESCTGKMIVNFVIVKTYGDTIETHKNTFVPK